MPSEPLWNSDELAAFLGIPRHTLDQWASQRVGPPYIKVGRHRRYDPAVVRKWIERQTIETEER